MSVPAEIRDFVRIRDQICRFCGQEEGNPFNPLTVHHILFPRSIYRHDPRRNQLKFLTLLCRRCHQRLHELHLYSSYGS